MIFHSGKRTSLHQAVILVDMLCCFSKSFHRLSWQLTVISISLCPETWCQLWPNANKASSTLRCQALQLMHTWLSSVVLRSCVHSKCQSSNMSCHFCNGIENDHWEWPQLVSCSTKPLSLLMVYSNIMGEVFVACNLQDVPNPGWKWNCHFGMSTMSSFDACVMCMSSVLCILDLLWETGPLLGSQKSIHPCHWTRHH